MSKIYCLGGSACCGKTKIAEVLAEKYNLQYYAFDDKLWENVARGAQDGNEWLQKVQAMTMDEMWLSEPEEMCKNAIKMCIELYPYVMKDLGELSSDCGLSGELLFDELSGGRDIIAEGAVFLPSMIEKYGINKRHYICMTPTEEFQRAGYSKRLWIADYLSKTSNKEKAYKNWMERDVLYAKQMRKEADALGLATLLVDGSKSVDEILMIVEKQLELEGGCVR